MQPFSLASLTAFVFAICVATSASWGQTLYQNPLDVSFRYDLKSATESGHPDFVLPSIEDPSKTIHLSNYRGKKVLLLHFASW